MTITPTPGRIVWYRAGDEIAAHHRHPHDGPLAAMIVGVHSDTCVNLLVHGFDGSTHALTSVPLHQSQGETPIGGCCWMPYQQGQAAKTDKLEAENQKIDALLRDLKQNEPPANPVDPAKLMPKTDGSGNATDQAGPTAQD